MPSNPEISPAPTSGAIPGGVVTFLFTDVEGSTKLWAADVEGTARSFVIHDRIIRDCIEAHGGVVFGTAGDSFRGAFAEPKSAVNAAVSATQALADTDWDGPPLAVRMGLHRGRATVRDGDYFGPVPNTASRFEAIASGGQILMSEAVRSAVSVDAIYLGDHRLRDVAEPMAIYQVGNARHQPLQAIDPELSTLPNSAEPIIGRLDEIREIRRRFDVGSLVTLTGIGGSGKTRLALEVAYQELPSRPDGCYFADLTPVSDPNELPAVLAAAIRLKLTGSDPLEQVVDYLATHDALLILDNCEHILDACAEFAECLLARSGSTILLATTRQRLDVDGEHVVVVPSLEHRGEGAPALELFAKRAAAGSPGFAIDDDNRDAVTEICARLDGMPLAIELAAARIAVLAPDELLERMADRFRLLSGGRGRQRRRTLQATLDWSFDLLDQEEQSFFARCGAFVGSFDLAAAAAVGGIDDYEAVDLLMSLLAKSLIQPSDRSTENEQPGKAPTRFRLLETVRIYAGDQLARSGTIAESRDRHLAHFVSATKADDWTTAGDIDRGATLARDWANIASALEWATIEGRWEDATSLALGCQGLWEHHLPATEGRRWLDVILPMIDQEPEPAQWLRYHRVLLAMQLDDFIAVHRGLEALENSPFSALRAQVLSLRGFTQLRQHPEQSVELFAAAEQLGADEALGPEALSSLHWGLGTLHLYSAQWDQARDRFSLAFDAATTDQRQLTHVIIAGLSLASAEILVGQPERCLDVLDHMDWSKSVWDSSPIVRGVALIDTGRADIGAQQIISFAQRALRGRLNRMSNDALVGFAALAIHRHEPDHAWTLLCQAATPRSPFTIGLAEGLADRIGRGDELRLQHRGRSTPLSQLDAATHLRAELRRLPSAGS